MTRGAFAAILGFWVLGCGGSRPDSNPKAAGGQVFVVTNGLGSGEVKIGLAKEGCGLDCPEIVGKGAAARLIGHPFAGSKFDGFSGPCQGREPCVVPLDEPRWVAASFSDAAARYQMRLGEMGHPSESPRALALDAGGGIFALATGEAWLVRYDRDGKKIWDLAGGLRASAVAADSSGDLLVVGKKDESKDGYVSKRGAAGGTAWEHVLRGSTTTDLCVDAAGDVVVVGTFSSVLKIGKQKVESAGGTDVFLARFGADGVLRGLERLGGASAEKAPRIATDGTSRFFVSYIEDGNETPGKGNEGTARVISFSPLGQRAWEVVVSGKSYLHALRARASGELVLAGRFLGSLDVGGKPLKSAGGLDAFVAVIDPSGSVLWAKSFGGKFDDEAAAIDVDAKGRVAVLGTFQNDASFDGKNFVAKQYPRTWHQGKVFVSEGQDVWLGVLSPEGNVESLKAFGGSGTDFARAVAWAVGGDVVMLLDQEELVADARGGGVASRYMPWILRRPPEAP